MVERRLIGQYEWTKSQLPLLEDVDIACPLVDAAEVRMIIELKPPAIEWTDEEKERHQTIRSLACYDRDKYAYLAFPRCQKLRRLFVSGPKFDDWWFNNFSYRWPNLESLTLHGVTGLDDDLDHDEVASYLYRNNGCFPRLKEFRILNYPLSDYDHLMLPSLYREKGIKFEHVENMGQSTDRSYIFRRPNQPPRTDGDGNFIPGQWRLEQAVLARGL